MRSLLRTRLRRVVALALAVALVAGSGAAVAMWSGSSDNPGNSLTAAVIGATGSVNATNGGGVCSTINVSWSAAAGATGYRVEAKTANGSYTTRIADAGNVTTWADTGGGFANREVTYRVTPLYAGTDWEGTPAVDATPLTCGVGEIDDLAASNTCNDTDLTWSAPTGATRYDVWRQIGGGSFTQIVTDQAGTTYSDATVHAPGTQVSYYIVPGSGTGSGNNGNPSNTATIASFDVFRVTSVQVNNTSVANRVDNGDNIVVTFSKPSNGTTPSGTDSTSIYLTRNGGSRGLAIAAGSGAANNTAIGVAGFSANVSGTNGKVTGTAAWSAGNTVWTWTRNVATTISFSAPTYSTWTVGTDTADPVRVKCSDGSSLLQASPSPTMSGWF